MNRRQRIAIAAKLSEIIISHGGKCIIEEDKAAYHCTHVAGEFKDVRVSIDVDNLHHGGLMANWHQASRKLLPWPFDSINEVHRSKATQYRNNADDFYEAFEEACSAVESGSAFDTI